MGTEQKNILVVNAGSSSIKFALFTLDLRCTLKVVVTNIGQPQSTLSINNLDDNTTQTDTVQAADHVTAFGLAWARIANHVTADSVVAIGHRVVHGGQTYNQPTAVTPAVIDELEGLATFDPEHAKAATTLLRLFHDRFPNVIQIACFDTAFYYNLPPMGRLLSLPRKLEKLGLRRYGFHGLSYEYLLESFAAIAGEAAANGRIIMAHLGSGASLAAIHHGQPVDTTMSFTPASGIPMSTRSGDIDPGIVAFLHQKSGMTIDEFNQMINFESGLLGVSELSSDMEVLIRESARNPQATEAVELFCYQVQKAIGSLTAVLGGLDSLIFTGGIVEGDPRIIEKICHNLEHLGVTIDTQRNHNRDFLISQDGGAVGVHAIAANEALTIAKHTAYYVRQGADYAVQ